MPYIPQDLALKHHYDTEPIAIDPRIVKAQLIVTAGLPKKSGWRHHPIRALEAWYRLGGGWKRADSHVSRSLHGFFITGGDWDLPAKPFQPLPTIVQLIEGADSDTTDEYQRLRNKIAARDFFWTRGMRSNEELDAYFANLVAVIEDIRTHGYRSQVELGNREADEIRVCVDRQGRLCVFGGGTHRLSIAQLLEVPEVPVVVKRVHAAWVSYCVDRYGGPIPAAIARGLEEVAARKPD